MILYLVLGGFLVPSFGSFGYYFMLDVVEIDKFTYSMLSVLGYICMFFGTQVYNKYFIKSEYRTLVMWDALITILMSPLTFIFVLRINVVWGVPDLFMIVFSETVGDILSQCFIFLPMSSIMARICP